MYAYSKKDSGPTLKLFARSCALVRARAYSKNTRYKVNIQLKIKFQILQSQILRNHAPDICVLVRARACSCELNLKSRNSTCQSNFLKIPQFLRDRACSCALVRTRFKNPQSCVPLRVIACECVLKLQFRTNYIS
jgi:hypothetical protein